MTNKQELLNKKKEAFEKKMFRRRMFFYTISSLLITLILFVTFYPSKTKAEDFIWEQRTVTEEKNTLWEIAEDLDLDTDIRNIIYLIEEENGINASELKSYDVIKVPVKEK